MGNGIIWTTTNNIDGYYVEKYLGVISKEIVFRNGLISSLGAAISNFTSAFNFRDVELKGSSELISNAKEYLMKEFEGEARRKGANAILGIDFETSFGTDLVKVSINGTAVRIAGINTTETTDEEEGGRKFSVKFSNITDEFIIAGIEIVPSFSQKALALSIIQKHGYEVEDIISDVVLQTRFGERHIIENVYFLNFKGNGRMFSSDLYPVDIPYSVFRTIDSIAVIVKKAICNGNIIEFKTDTLSDVEIIKEEDASTTAEKMVSVVDFYNDIKKCRSEEELFLSIKLASSVFGQKEYTEFDEKVQKEFDKDGKCVNGFALARISVLEALIHVMNNMGGMEAIPLEKSNWKCPLCGTVQIKGRSKCYSCGLILSLQES